MDVPAYEIVFCISKTQYSLCRQHKCPLFHDIVFYAHYTSFAMRCQHNSTLFLLLWLVFLVDFCGFSLFLLRYQVKQKAFSDFHILISENAKKNCHIRFLQYSSFLIFLFTSYVKYLYLIHSSMAVSTAASAVPIAAFSAFFIFYNASDCKTCDCNYDSAYNYCSHTILLSGYPKRICQRLLSPFTNAVQNFTNKHNHDLYC